MMTLYSAPKIIKESIPLLTICIGVEVLIGQVLNTNQGLMTIPKYFEAAEDSRPLYRRMKELQRKINEHEDRRAIEWLSMGMSHDYEVAIEEGANIVRVGSAIFGE